MLNRNIRLISGKLPFIIAHWPIITIILLTSLTYVGGLQNPLTGEDFDLPALSNLTFDEMWRINIANRGRIRPIFWSVGWLLSQVFKSDPLGYHITNLVFHVGTSIMIFYLAVSLSGDKRVGLISALVFSVYPRHHEPVLWPAANHYVICGFYFITCLVAYSKYLTTRKFTWQLISWFCLVITLMTHESGVILFFLIPFMEFIFSPIRISKERLYLSYLYKYLPYLILLVLYIVINFAGPRSLKLNTVLDETQWNNQGLVGETYHFSGWSINKIKDIFSYLTYLIYPQIPLRSLDPNLWTILLALVTSILMLFFFMKGSPMIRYLIIWIILGIVPFVLFVPFGNADRYFYLSAAGLSILLGICLIWSFDKLKIHYPTLSWMTIGGFMILYLVSSIILLQFRITEWRKAGEITSGVVSWTLSKFPNPQPGDIFLYVDLPGKYGQAMVFQGGGIKTAMMVAYNRKDLTFNVYQTRDPKVSEFLVRAPAVDKPVPGLYVFLYQDGVLIEKTYFVDNIDSLHPNSWYDY